MTQAYKKCQNEDYKLAEAEPGASFQQGPGIQGYILKDTQMCPAYFFQHAD